jgi:gliding motility-associated protein GldM
MGHGKETPRQKMIGLMYLFLTAMLALNVSKEVLNSFILVGNSLEKTIENYKSKNDKVYNEFDKAHMQNPEKVGPWKDKADQVKKKATELIDALEQHKIDLVKYAESDDAPSIATGKFDIGKLVQKDNIDKGGEYFGELGKKNGEKIEKQIDEYRELLVSIIPDSQKALKHTIETTLETEGHDAGDLGTISWVSHTFEHIPLIADFVMLAKLQTDVKNMETDAINYLFGQISAGDFKVNKIDAVVIAKSNYVMTGSDYSADVFIAAYDSTQNPEVYVGEFKNLGEGKYEIPDNAQKLDVVNGKGVYIQPGKVVGEKKWGGLIKLIKPDGGESYYPFKTEYQVAKSNVVISPTKMNVFYTGIDNPVDISVPGIPSTDIIPRITSGARITKVANGYEVRPSVRKGKVNVLVYATIEGAQKLMGSMEFRIRTVPPPIAKVMGQSSGSISRAMLSSAPYLYAELEDFLFDLKFEITEFTMVSQEGIYTNEMKTKGNKFSKEQKDAIKGSKKGSRITIENIEARGPDGRAVPLSPIVFKLK